MVGLYGYEGRSSGLAQLVDCEDGRAPTQYFFLLTMKYRMRLIQNKVTGFHLRKNNRIGVSLTCCSEVPIFAY
jgi:hypothetical protein